MARRARSTFATMSPRPYLLLDVDGPLNPHRAVEPPPGYDRHTIREGEKTWNLLLNQQHGVELNGLADVFQLVWASSWEHGANRLIAARLGLPDTLPVIVWPKGPRDRSQRSWKTPYVADWVGDRPFVWIDDEIDDRDRAYLTERSDLGPHLLHPVEADRGLDLSDFAAIRAWADLNC